LWGVFLTEKTDVIKFKKILLPMGSGLKLITTNIPVLSRMIE